MKWTISQTPISSIGVSAKTACWGACGWGSCKWPSWFLLLSKIQWRSGFALCFKSNTREGNGSELEGIRIWVSILNVHMSVHYYLFWYSEGLISGHFQILDNDCLRMLWRRFRDQVVSHHPAQSIWFFFSSWTELISLASTISCLLTLASDQIHSCWIIITAIPDTRYALGFAHIISHKPKKKKTSESRN